jgi:anti-anti-sigma factor
LSIFGTAVLARIDVSSNGDAVAIAIAGELDLVDRDAFADVLQQVRATHPAKIEIDLTNLDFLGVPLIQVLEHHRREAGGRVVVTNAQGVVKRILDLVDFAYEN